MSHVDGNDDGVGYGVSGTSNLVDVGGGVGVVGQSNMADGVVGEGLDHWQILNQK